MKRELAFTPGGKFRILLLTDLHANFERKTYGSLSLAMLHCMIRDAMPDLLVLTGDIGVPQAYNRIMQIAQQYHIPTAVTFGNHEPAGEARRELLEQYRYFACCLNPAPELPDGRCTTFFLPVFAQENENPVFGLWFCDTAPDGEPDGGEYITPEQIAWFRKNHAALQAINDGKPLPSLWFQHIIFPEIYDALLEVPAGTPRSMPCFMDKKRRFIPDSSTLLAGTLNEMPCIQLKNFGMFDAVAEAGGILACFSGHDHDNDFVIRHRGLDLINTPKGCYRGSYNAKHGGRMIELDLKDLTTYKTRIVPFASLYSMRHYLQNKDVLTGGLGAVARVRSDLLHRNIEDLVTAWIPEKYRETKGITVIKNGERIWKSRSETEKSDG